MNEGDSTPNPNAFEEPTVEGLLFFGVPVITKHLTVIVIYMTLTSSAVGKFNILT